MRSWSRAVAALLLLTGTISVASAAPPDLRLVSTVWPPFTDMAGQPRLASDLVHEALRRSGLTSDTAIVPDGELVPALRSGSFAGCGALWRSAERESFLLYSDSYLENRLVLVGRKGSDVAAANLADLAGKRIALVKGYAYGAEVDDADSAILLLGDSIEKNLQSVLDGEADYLLLDELVIRYIVNHHKEDAVSHLEIGSVPLVRRSLHLAIRKDVPDAESVLAGFNAQIRRMLADGAYNRILGLDWIHADVDGDGWSELVLHGDRAGQSSPTDAYEVVATDAAEAAPQKKLRFLIGGNLYKDWEEVPAQYKVPASGGLDPAESPAPVFKIKF